MSLLSLTSARWTWGVLCWGDRLSAGFADVLRQTHFVVFQKINLNLLSCFWSVFQSLSGTSLFVFEITLKVYSVLHFQSSSFKSFFAFAQQKVLMSAWILPDVGWVKCRVYNLWPENSGQLYFVSGGTKSNGPPCFEHGSDTISNSF